MAETQVGNLAGIAARGGTGNTNINGGDNANAGHTDADYATIAAMRTRLAAINGSYFTAARLNEMTYNDMMYAIRLNDSAGSI